MKDIVPRIAAALGTSDRLSRPAGREVEAIRRRAVTATAKINAAAYVTHTALTFTAALSAEEARLVQQCPLGEARYKAIVDHFAGVACAEIAEMAW